jgi:hypothetical protein|tara:strand:+ start:454 stop:759 length:306 start_codon:yes stop_codon:yes gene_type:complete
MSNRYQYNQILRTSLGRRYFSTTKYPLIPPSEEDIYVYTTDEDRYDLLAYQYYQDPTLYWVILIGNPQLPQDTLSPPVGSQIRIPGNIQSVLTSFEKINNG